MLKLIKYAEIVNNKYRFEIDCKFTVVDLFRAKFENDQKNIKRFCNSIYKNHTSK